VNIAKLPELLKRPGIEAKKAPSEEPVGTYAQAIRLSGAREKVAKKTYIRATKFPNPAFDKAGGVQG
jgi:hypothetical protein